MVAALVFTVIVAGTGSLLIAMMVHALWDLRVLLFTLPHDHPLLASEATAPERSNGPQIVNSSRQEGHYVRQSI